MFRKVVFKVMASFLLMFTAIGLTMPVSAYAQTQGTHAQSTHYASGKCEKIKDKKKKKDCESKEKKGKTKKNDDGPNHDANDDHGAGHP